MERKTSVSIVKFMALWIRYYVKFMAQWIRDYVNFMAIWRPLGLGIMRNLWLPGLRIIEIYGPSDFGLCEIHVSLN